MSVRVVILALLFAAAGALAQGIKLEPADEAGGDPTWVRFKKDLLAAIEKQDKKFILAILDPRVRNGMGTPDGAAEFKKQWDFDASPKEFWVELRRILFLGGVWVKQRGGAAEFCAPYVALKWPEAIDPYNHGAIIARNVLVKSQPSAAADTVAQLAYDIVGVKDWEVPDADPRAAQKWVDVVLSEDREGFVPEEQIRSAVEHRACFRRGKDGWKLTALVAGE